MFQSSENFFHFLEKLAEKTLTAGLQISDSALHLVLIGKKRKIQTFSLRIPPGVIEFGRIKQKEPLLNLLNQLHSLVYPQKPKHLINVVVSLPAELIFLKEFEVPYLTEEELGESALLNLRMYSPLSPTEGYFSWQVIGQKGDQYEILGAVAEKKAVDELKDLLTEARFLPIILEFPALALSRVINRSFSSKEATLFFHLSSDGLDFFILKDGNLYFDYFRSWQSIQGENRQITKEVFEMAIVEEVQKVINFISGRFHENLKKIILIAYGLEEEIKQVVEKHFEFEVSPLVLKTGEEMELPLLIAYGSALRGEMDRSRDTSITFAPLNSIEQYYQQQVLKFIEFWQGVIAGVLLIFLIIFALAAIFLSQIFNQIDYRLRSEEIEIAPQQKEVQKLTQKAEEFNRLVSLINNLQTSDPRWLAALKHWQDLGANYQIIINRIEARSFTEPVILSGQAPTADLLFKFKEDLAADPTVSNVDLPIANISVLDNGSVNFTLSFILKPAPSR